MDSMYIQYHNIHTGLQAIFIQEEGSYIYYIHNGFIQSLMVQLDNVWLKKDLILGMDKEI